MIIARDISDPAISIITSDRIAKSGQIRLTAELKESNDWAMKATEIMQLAEEGPIRFKSAAQAAEMEKQILQQQVQDLTDLVEYFRNTTTQSVDDEFINKLKLNLNLFATG
ncbi:hypothetical protein ABVK25_011324 [Lepraria finkii]|uniref:Uncharacterized protein n=1 Tax=Lepraria finkii TaxID=1340010 RepID=A0ABR4ARQ2_9LECA